jgi:hypothetical protein
LDHFVWQSVFSKRIHPHPLCECTEFCVVFIPTKITQTYVHANCFECRSKIDSVRLQPNLRRRQIDEGGVVGYSSNVEEFAGIFTFFRSSLLMCVRKTVDLPNNDNIFHIFSLLYMIYCWIGNLSLNFLSERNVLTSLLFSIWLPGCFRSIRLYGFTFLFECKAFLWFSDKFYGKFYVN